MNSIEADVNEAAHFWVDNLTVKDKKYNQSQNIHEKIERTMLQMKFEGEITTQIEFIGKLWNDVLITLQSDASNEQFITKLLLLFEAGGISRIFLHQLLTILCNNNQ